MKVFIFSVVIATNAVLVLGYSDKELANLILGDVTSILPQVNTLLGNLNKVLNGLKPIDFGIRKRYRIQQLQEDVNAKTGKPNIKTCNDTLNSYVQSVEHGFQKMVRTKLGEQRDKISKLVSTLNTLKPKLEACKNEGKDCGDLNKLNRDMFDYKNFLRDHTDLGSSNVAQIYAGYYVTSEMLEKDEMKVITPVKNCLKTIK